MKKKLFGILLLIALLMACLMTAATAEEKPVLTAPVDFVFDTSTGKFTFTTTDENAGYYFVRVYPVIGGEEATEYVASSKRINAGKLGEKSGKVDVSTIGWGAYNVKLITFAAAGTGYSSPEPVVITAFYGVGGILEKPEYMAVVDGNTVEFTADWYTLSHYKDFQHLPTLRYSAYTDAECTQLVASADYNTNNLVVDTHPTMAYIWEYSLTTGHMNYTPAAGGGPGGGPGGPGGGGGETTSYCLIPQVTLVLDAGTYYLTVQAISDDESKIASSKVSDVIEVTVTADAPNGEFETFKSGQWTDPSVMGMPTANSSGAQDRVDMTSAQTTTSYAK